MQNNKNKKKRKLKKGFKIFLYLILFIIILILIFIFKNKILNSYKYYIAKIYTKEKILNIENMSNDEFTNIFRMRLPSQNMDYSYTGEIEENGDMKIFLKNTKDAYIYVNTKDDADYVWITFVSAIDGEPLKSSINKSFEDLNYIDLRFGNKVFYKFYNNSVELNNND